MNKIQKKLTQVKPGSLFAGLDLSLDSIAVVVVDSQNQRVDRFKTANSQDGYDYLRQRLQKSMEKHHATGLWLGMEPTNYYWKHVATFLAHHDLPYRLVNAYTVKRHREGDQLDTAKDDWRDAAMIADLVRTGKFTESQLRTGVYAELQVGYAAFCRLRLDRGRQLTLLTNTTRQVFPEFEQAFKDLTGQTARAVLYTGPAAADIQQQSVADFIAQVRAAATTQRLAVSRLRQLHSLAQHSIGLADGREALCLDIQNCLLTLQVLDAASQRQLNHLKTLFHTLPEAPYLLSIQGLDQLSALGILAETGDLAQYTSGKDLIKLAGTQPTPNASGRYSRSRTPFSHQGRSRLRTVVYWATLRLLSRNDAIAYHYQRWQTRAVHPLTKMEAVGACMNKLLWYVWHVAHGREKYDPDHWNTLN